MKGTTITDLQDEAFDQILLNINIVKALIIKDENFINTTPTSEQNNIINNPSILLRQQIFPYMKNIKTPTNPDNAKPCITSAWTNFRKVGSTYHSGRVYFYILIPLDWEKTIMGIRYNYIADQFDKMFCNSNIGDFELYDRGDLDRTPEGYIGHYIAFNILDFHINECDNNA